MGKNNEKNVWEKPQLLVLTRWNAEETLASFCKIDLQAGASSMNDACFENAECNACTMNNAS